MVLDVKSGNAVPVNKGSYKSVLPIYVRTPKVGFDPVNPVAVSEGDSQTRPRKYSRKINTGDKAATPCWGFFGDGAKLTLNLALSHPAPDPLTVGKKTIKPKIRLSCLAFEEDVVVEFEPGETTK